MIRSLEVRSAAAADERVDRMGIHALRLEHVEDDAPAERHLVVHMGKGEQHRSVVEEAALEDRPFVLEKAHLCRCRPRVDYENLEFFHCECYADVAEPLRGAAAADVRT